MDKTLNYKKNFWWNILGTGLSSFNSLFLMIIVTRLNGINDAGIFTLAFSTACVLYVIGIYSGRVYQVTESDKCITDKDYFLHRSIVVLIMIVSVFVFVFMKGYGFYKSEIFVLLVVFKSLEAISDVLYGVMQKNDCLYRVGQSYFVKGLLTLIVFFVADYYTRNLLLSIILIIVVWVVGMMVLDLPFVAKMIDKNTKARWKHVLILFKNGFYVFAIMFMGLYITNASKYALDNYSTNEYQTILGIIMMPATAISLFGQFVFHPYLGRMAELNENKEYKELNHLILKVVYYILGFGLLGTVAAYFLGVPVLSFVYGIDISKYRIHLVAIILAATLYNMGGTFSSMLTTMRKTFVQFVMYIVFGVFAWFSADILTKESGITGAVKAYVALMVVFLALYWIVTKIIVKKKLSLEK